MYRIKLTTKAKKELKTISKLHQQAIAFIYEELKDNPYLGKPLTKELTGRFTLRVGFNRIIYKINKKDEIVLILTAGHRATVYE